MSSAEPTSGTFAYDAKELLPVCRQLPSIVDVRES